MEGNLISFDDDDNMKPTFNPDINEINSFNSKKSNEATEKTNSNDSVALTDSLFDKLLIEQFNQLSLNPDLNVIEQKSKEKNQEVGEQKIFEGSAAIFTRNSDTNTSESASSLDWKPLVEGISSIAIFHSLQDSLFRIVALSPQNEFIINSWIGTNVDAAMQDKFVVSFNFQVGKDFGFHFTEQDKAIEFEKSYVNCAQVTNQKFQDDWKIVLRKKSLHEILLTEESYIDSLQLLVNIYLNPLRQLFGKSSDVSSNEISTSEIKTIFMDIESVLLFNKRLFERIEEAISSSQRIGRVFLDLKEYFKIYRQYVNGYIKSSETLAKCKKKSKSFKLFLRKCVEHPLCERKSIEDFLIMPVQRIPRYILLLEDLLKYTSRTHEDYEDIVLALMKMREVASEINEARREAEYFQELLKVYKRLSPKPPDLLEPHRKILAEGDIFHIKSKKKTSRRYLFLFNDVLLITRSEEKKFILRIWVSLPSARIEIRENSQFNIVTPKKEVVLKGKSEEDTHKWANLIKQTITTFLRISQRFVNPNKLFD